MRIQVCVTLNVTSHAQSARLPGPRIIYNAGHMDSSQSHRNHSEPIYLLEQSCAGLTIARTWVKHEEGDAGRP